MKFERSHLIAAFCSLAVFGLARNSSTPSGTLTINLPASNPEAPSYQVISPGFNGEAVYIGPVLSVSENNITFDTVTDLVNPTRKIGPFTHGVFASKQARATCSIDSNGSIVNPSLVDPGDQYLHAPSVFISPPVQGTVNSSITENAYAKCEIESGRVSSIIITNEGRGYTYTPSIAIDGGPHFVRITENDSNYSGLCFKILGNSDTTIELENLSDFQLSNLLKEGTVVEIFKAWTLGSLFGYENTELASNSNSLLADWVYLCLPPDQQNGDTSFTTFFHDNDSWKEVANPTNEVSTRCIYPDEAIIIARRFDEELNLQLRGNVLLGSSFWRLPPQGKQLLVSNPYPVEIKLSDLIKPEFMTDGNSSEEGHLWYTHHNPDMADNIKILNDTVWSTYWHDRNSSNLNVSRKAKISARKGSGIGGRLTPGDFSFSEGNITDIESTAGSGSYALITSPGHGLKKGFTVTISNVKGYRINSDNKRIDGSGNEIEEGFGLIINSSLNGSWQIQNLTADTFELVGSSLDCEFLPDQNASWSTGFQGEGYDRNVTLTILGGGGTGAQATGIVENGSITSISLKSGGFSYITAPEVIVHDGGWRSLLTGNVPISNLTIPAGSGLLIVRNHPSGIETLMPLNKISQP